METSYLLDYVDRSNDGACMNKDWSEEAECDHYGNKCFRIKNVSIDKFNHDTFIKKQLSREGGDNDSDVIEALTTALGSLSLESNFFGEIENSYYGDSAGVSIHSLERFAMQVFEAAQTISEIKKAKLVYF